MTKRIDSLQGLRTLAFLGVFFEHVGITATGGWGVSVFLVMSGWLSQYNYDSVHLTELKVRESKNSRLKSAIHNGMKKLKRLYPLHILTFAIAAIWGGNSLDLSALRKIIISLLKIVTNISLTQAWIPKSEFYFSFNSVSWYLSVCLYIYCIAPMICRYINRMTLKKSLLVGAGIVMVQIAISSVLYIYQDVIRAIPIVISDNLIKWVTYICPLYRSGDFVIGCLVGRGIGTVKEKSSSHIFMMEMLALALVCLELYFYKKLIYVSIADPFKYSLLYLPGSLLLVVLASSENGLLSNIFSNKLFVAIGNLTPFAFLLHQPVIHFLMTEPLLCRIGRFATAIICLCITLMLSWIYAYCQKKHQ